MPFLSLRLRLKLDRKHRTPPNPWIKPMYNKINRGKKEKRAGSTYLIYPLQVHSVLIFYINNLILFKGNTLIKKHCEQWCWRVSNTCCSFTSEMFTSLSCSSLSVSPLPLQAEIILKKQCTGFKESKYWDKFITSLYSHNFCGIQNFRKLFWLGLKGALQINTLHFHIEYTFIQLKENFSKHKTERMFLKYFKLLSGVLGLQLKDYINNFVVSVRLIVFSYIQEKFITAYFVNYLPIPSERLIEYLNPDTQDLH